MKSKYSFIYKVLILIIGLYLQSCSADTTGVAQNGGTGSQNESSPYTYRMKLLTIHEIEPEYSTYYLIPNEERPIMVGGFSQKEFTYLETNGIDGKLRQSPIGYGVDQAKWKSESGSYYGFTAPLNIGAVGFYGGENGNTFKITGKTDGGTSVETLNDVTAIVAYRRSFSARYYGYMKNHDISPYIDEQKIKNAFYKSNTTFSIDKSGTKELADESLNWSYTEDVGAYIAAVVPEEDNLPDKSIFILGLNYYSFVMPDPVDTKKYLLSDCDIAYTHMVIYRNTTTKEIVKELAFILEFDKKINDKVDNLNGMNSTWKITKSQATTFFTLHELGHSRGMDLMSKDANNQETHYYPGLTGTFHTEGHNGVNSKYCVMRSGADPDFTRPPNNDYSNKPPIVSAMQQSDMGFCSGHNQMLFNCIWKGELQP